MKLHRQEAAVMENNKENKVKDFFRKLYHFRVKVDKQGKPILNVCSLFGLVCLIFAPKLTLISVVLSLLLGYQYRFESEEMDDSELEERLRKAALNVKNGAIDAAKSIQNEISKARKQNGEPLTKAEAEKTAKEIVEKVYTAAPESTQEAAASNEELLKDLEAHAEETMESNPAATTFHSAYAASAGSVPVLQVPEEPAETAESKPRAARSRKK